MLAALLLGGCDHAGQRAIEAPAPPHSRLPGLSLGPDGAPVLSWVEDTPTGHRLAYSVLDGEVWRERSIVVEGAGWFVNWADVPSVIPLSETLWAAHWLISQPGGMYAYDIALSLSADGGRTWTAPVRPHDDATPTEHGFVSLWPATLPDGGSGVGMVWLDGREMLLDPAAGGAHDPRTTLRYGLFDPHGDRVAAGLVDDRVCDCCPTAVASSADGPTVVYRDRSRGEVRDIRAARFSDGSWQPLGTVADDGWEIAGCPVNGPAAAARGERFAVAWYTEADGLRRVRSAQLGRAGWSEPVDVAAGRPLGRVGIAWLDAEHTAVSWLDDIGDGQAALRLARVSRSAAGAPMTIARTESSRPAGVPRLVRVEQRLLLAWTRWVDGTSQVVTRQVPVAQLPPVGAIDPTASAPAVGDPGRG